MIKSDKFNDVYFSVDGGVDETHYVFLDGNDLPNRWMGQDRFTIAELGFGTGLNFLCAWRMFEETSSPDQRLHFISVEKYPLSKKQITEALAGWSDYFDGYLDKYLNQYPLRIPGPHKIYLTNRVTLTLWIGDVLDIMPQWKGQVDAWFLDGFTPSKNADMWSDVVFQNMARLSHAKTSYATFTAAGDVRRGLAENGFSVEKAKGFARKREMIKGHFVSDVQKQKLFIPKNVAIVGGGLSGCALAYIFAKQGIKVTIYESGDSLANGASGGKLGMINPQLRVKPAPQSTYMGCAYAMALREYSQMDGIEFSIHGSTYLCLDDDKERKFSGYVENLGWHEDHIKRDGKNLIYPDGGSVSPYKLCHVMAKDADVRLGHKIDDLADIDADYIIVANGHAIGDLFNLNWPIYSIRGQVSWVKPQAEVKHNICFGGYITPKTSEGFHVLGSTFIRHDEDVDVRSGEHHDNIDKYNNGLNKNLNKDDVVGGWAGIRCSTTDYFPVVGHVCDNIYVSTAHGSHGIISSIMAAEIICSQILGDEVPASDDVLRVLSPKRFRKC